MPFVAKRSSERYERIVPMRFRNQSGFNAISFRVVNAWQSPFQYIKDPRGGAIQIPPSAYCEIENGRVFLVDINKHPVLAEAILLLGQLLSTNERAQRYNILFKIYECLEPNTKIEFAAIRHALSHATTMLSRPKTVEALNKLFGSAKINLQSYRHQQVFYTQLVLLLKETDIILFTTIKKQQHLLRHFSSPGEVLHDWQIVGVPGLYEPIPLRINNG